MAYQTGSWQTQANPAGYLMEQVLTPMLEAHPAWEFVYSWMPDAIWTYAVWRNLGTQNSWGQDWYLILFYSTTTMELLAAEGIDQATNSVIRPVPNRTDAPAPDGSLGGGTAYAMNSSVYTMRLNATAAANPYTYRLGVTADTVLLAGTSTSSHGVMAGLFESLMPGEPFPLAVVNLTNGTANAGGWSRHPNLTVSNTNNWDIAGGSYTTAIWTKAVGSVASSSVDTFHGAAVGSRIMTYPTGSYTTHGQIRGLYRHILYFNVATGVAAGDTITVNGETYVYIGGNVFYSIAAD